MRVEEEGERGDREGVGGGREKTFWINKFVTCLNRDDEII